MEFVDWYCRQPLVTLLMTLVPLAAFLVLSLWGKPRERGRGILDWEALMPPWFFMAGMGFILLLFQWPTLFFPTVYNVDEAQMLAQAMKFTTDPLPWRSVDGTTSGPLNSWVLLLPKLAGIAPGYGSARAVGMLCIYGMLAFAYLTLRRIIDETDARLALVAPLLFAACPHDENFIHYSSERLPVLLTAAAIYAAFRALEKEPPRRGLLYLASLLFGALPFTKLQAGPIGIAGLLALAFIIFLRWRRTRTPLEYGNLAVCVAGGATVPAILLAFVSAGGAFNDFLLSYLGLHSHHSGFLDSLELAHPFLLVFEEFKLFWITTIGIALLLLKLRWGLRHRTRDHPRPGNRNWLWISAYTAVCLFVVFFRGANYGHYAIFLIHPFALLGGLVLEELRRVLVCHRSGPRARLRLHTAVTVFFFAGLVLPHLTREFFYQPQHRLYADYFPEWEQPLRVRVIREIKNHSSPGDRLAVWGWSPDYYVESGRIPATRDAITQMAMIESESPHTEYYRERFLDDLAASRARLFVDAAPVFVPEDVEGFFPHETVPSLAAYVRKHYRLTESLAVGWKPGAVRLYVRREKPATRLEGDALSSP